jgi:hypothetical protein
VDARRQIIKKRKFILKILEIKVPGMKKSFEKTKLVF